LLQHFQNEDICGIIRQYSYFIFGGNDMGPFGGEKRNLDELSVPILYSRGIRHHKKKEYTEAFAYFELYDERKANSQ